MLPLENQLRQPTPWEAAEEAAEAVAAEEAAEEAAAEAEAEVEEAVTAVAVMGLAAWEI